MRPPGSDSPRAPGYFLGDDPTRSELGRTAELAVETACVLGPLDGMSHEIDESRLDFQLASNT